MHAKRFEPRPDSAMLGYSVLATMDAARSIRSPQWDCCTCDLESLIRSEIDGLKGMIGGLTLGDFGKGRSPRYPRVLERRPQPGIDF